MPLPRFQHRDDDCLITLLLCEGKVQNMGRSPTVSHDPVVQPNCNKTKQLSPIKYNSVNIIQLLPSS